MVTRSDPSFRLSTGAEPVGFRTGRSPDEGASFSGHERDRVFLNLGGGRFQDVSAVSGADDPGDGRVFALLDFDRDGLSDIALANANAPSLEIYRNRFGADPSRRSEQNVLALRFVGANQGASAKPGASARDGFGAMVTVDLGDRKLVRQHRAGEGFAAQNSATMLIGLGASTGARGIEVRWPSGKRQTVPAVPANHVVTIREPGEDSSVASGFDVAPYTAGAKPTAPATDAATAPPRPNAPAGGAGRSRANLVLPLPAAAGDPDLRVFTTFATWCQACRADVPQFERLREAFPASQVGLFSVPADEDDDRAKIAEWMDTRHPPYLMLSDLSPADLAKVKRLLLEKLGREALPSTIVTDREGTVLTAMLGTPTVSDLRALAPSAHAPLPPATPGTTAPLADSTPR